MLLGYNTNGFAHHHLSDALAILSEIGYRSVAITLERDHLDPPDRRGVPACVALLQPLIRAFRFRVTIETGSRFVLDPRRKHQPTLISRCAEARRRRIDFLKAAIDVAAALPADSVALWSGAAEDPGETGLLDRLASSLHDVLEHAAAREVRLSFEPEPGMLIDTMARFEQLCAAVHHDLFGLTLDVGHIRCLGDGSAEEHIRRWSKRLWNVHVEDMRRGVHEHLMFGQGEVEFPSVFDALRQVGYEGPVHVELSRHSHDAVEAAKRSYRFLRSFLEQDRNEKLPHREGP